MNEKVPKPTSQQLKAAEKNRDASIRRRDILEQSLVDRTKLLEVKMRGYNPGPDFKATMSFQQDPEFWKLSQKVDELQSSSELIELKDAITQIQERIDAYTETLSQRG